MIGKLTGTAGETLGGSVVVDVAGVGYLLRVPMSLLPKQGSKVTYFVHTAVREDAIDLYGFPTREELSFFKQLLAVSGVGPKTALGILNLSEVKTLKRSIAQGDSSALTKVFGIGKKSAERIVVELRDKVTVDLAAGGGSDVEVLEALIALGYSAVESREALKKIGANTIGVNNRLSEALKYVSRV